MAARRRSSVLLVSAALIAAICAVYTNSLDAPFVFDDPAAIVDNPTIRRLWPLSDVLVPPRGEGVTVEGRPVVNLTLALNYALGGTSPRGYHLFNVAVHALAALTLFGLVRRTLLLPRLYPGYGDAALPLAAASAFLWALHPLQTESVTYIVQRAESLVSLFYLLTFYCFVRAVEGSEAPRSLPRRLWRSLAFAACLLGMATKEIMVSAPLLVLLFDRTFLSGSFRHAWRDRGRFHATLFATWLLLIALVLRTGTRGGTAGFGIGVTPWDYALTQFEAISRYVALAFWPHPLIFDYGAVWVHRPADVLPYAVIVLGLIVATVVSWRRAPAAAFLGLLFFAVLSPTSSVVPGNRQTIAEHRMYLPLAPVLVLAVCGLWTFRPRRLPRAFLFASMAPAVAFALLTIRRNLDYRSELALYRDTAVKRPINGFARYNYAKALAESGHHAAALPEYTAALRFLADSPGVHYNLANSLVALGRPADALPHYEAALRAAPTYARAHFNLGNALLALDRKADALTHFTAAADADPTLLEARANLGGLLLDLNRLPEARRHLEHVLRVDPRHVLALFNLANVCLLEQRWPEAIRHFETVLALQPDLTLARERLELVRRSH